MLTREAHGIAKPAASLAAGQGLAGGCVLPEYAGLDPVDADRWMSAASLAELGELTALWLEGEIGQTPMNYGPPAEETTELVPFLVAVNRAGFVTDCSQPGMSKPWQGSILGWNAPPGSLWCQRAAVSGFASEEGCHRLASLADPGVLCSITVADPVWPVPPGWNVTRIGAGANWLEATWFGEQIPRAGLEADYGAMCQPAAVAALCDARQVTLIDPAWDRNDRLWPLLERFAASHRGRARSDHARLRQSSSAATAETGIRHSTDTEGGTSAGGSPGASRRLSAGDPPACR
jgi:hypothetical protein